MAVTVTAIWSLAALLLPTWKVNDWLEDSRLVEPYLVAVEMRSISASEAVTSLLAAVRDSVSWVPLAAWTARSRTRCRMAVVSSSAPSPVCSMLMPSWAFWLACWKPPIWARSFSLMERPAASSAARLMRKPEDSFSRLDDIAFCVSLRCRYAFIAPMLVLICRPILSLLDVGSGAPIRWDLTDGCRRFHADRTSIGAGGGRLRGFARKSFGVLADGGGHVGRAQLIEAGRHRPTAVGCADRCLDEDGDGGWRAGVQPEERVSELVGRRNHGRRLDRILQAGVGPGGLPQDPGDQLGFGHGEVGQFGQHGVDLAQQHCGQVGLGASRFGEGFDQRADVSGNAALVSDRFRPLVGRFRPSLQGAQRGRPVDRQQGRTAAPAVLVDQLVDRLEPLQGLGRLVGLEEQLPLQELGHWPAEASDGGGRLLQPAEAQLAAGQERQCRRGARLGQRSRRFLEPAGRLETAAQIQEQLGTALTVA